jgi:D-3-phosphoglycerate dehydrogenase / 2-oxoglutarate reductase
MTDNGGHGFDGTAADLATVPGRGPDPATVPGNPDSCVIVVAEGALHAPGTVAAHFRGDATIRVADISTAGQVKAATSGASGLVVALQRLPAELVEAIDPGLRVIGRMGIGTDTVDLEAAAACGLTVFNEPAYGVSDVASHAVAMLLAVNRRLVPADRHVRQGWAAGSTLSLAPMPPLDEMTVGIIGCGRIGTAVAALLAPMVAQVLVYDPLRADGGPPGTERLDDLDDLLARSDAVTVHAPLTPQTRGILGRRELALLPRGALVINVSRGGQVDEQALAELLTTGQLGGAGLDTFGAEPLPADSPLLDAPNTLLSPHCAGYSERAAWRLDIWTVGDAIGWLRTGRLRYGGVVVAGTR